MVKAVRVKFAGSALYKCAPRFPVFDSSLSVLIVYAGFVQLSVLCATTIVCHTLKHDVCFAWYWNESSAVLWSTICRGTHHSSSFPRFEETSLSAGNLSGCVHLPQDHTCRRCTAVCCIRPAAGSRQCGILLPPPLCCARRIFYGGSGGGRGGLCAVAV